MAGLASGGSCNMVSRFTFGGCTVMATGTARGDASVIHFSTFKAGGRAMAGLASGGSCNMVRRFTFGSCTVMAASTANNDACVVECSANK